MGRQKIMHQMLTCVPKLNPFLISSLMWFWVSFPSIATLSKDLLAVCILWCPSFWWPDMNLYLGFSVLTSRPTFLWESDGASAFLLWYLWFCSVNWHHQHRPETDVHNLSFDPSWFSWTFLMAYSEAVAIEHVLVSCHSEKEILQIISVWTLL